jgi:hypothetical protein
MKMRIVKATVSAPTRLSAQTVPATTPMKTPDNILSAWLVVDARSASPEDPREPR